MVPNSHLFNTLLFSVAHGTWFLQGIRCALVLSTYYTMVSRWEFLFNCTLAFRAACSFLSLCIVSSSQTWTSPPCRWKIPAAWDRREEMSICMQTPRHLTSLGIERNIRHRARFPMARLCQASRLTLRKILWGAGGSRAKKKPKHQNCEAMGVIKVDTYCQLQVSFVFFYIKVSTGFFFFAFILKPTSQGSLMFASMIK